NNRKAPPASMPTITPEFSQSSRSPWSNAPYTSASPRLKYANPRQLILVSLGGRGGIPKYTRTPINGVATAAVQKIQCQERCSMYQPSINDAILVTNTISAAYAAMPKIIIRFG